MPRPLIHITELPPPSRFSASTAPRDDERASELDERHAHRPSRPSVDDDQQHGAVGRHADARARMAPAERATAPGRDVDLPSSTICGMPPTESITLRPPERPREPDSCRPVASPRSSSAPAPQRLDASTTLRRPSVCGGEAHRTHVDRVVPRDPAPRVGPSATAPSGIEPHRTPVAGEPVDASPVARERRDRADPRDRRSSTRRARSATSPASRSLRRPDAAGPRKLAVSSWVTAKLAPFWTPRPISDPSIANGCSGDPSSRPEVPVDRDERSGALGRSRSAARTCPSSGRPRRGRPSRPASDRAARRAPPRARAFLDALVGEPGREPMGMDPARDSAPAGADTTGETASTEATTIAAARLTAAPSRSWPDHGRHIGARPGHPEAGSPALRRGHA